MGPPRPLRKRGASGVICAARFQIGAKSPTRRGVQGHLALLASLALPDPDRSGALAELQVSRAKRRRLADAELGLDQKLDHGVIAPRVAVPGFTGDPQKGMDFGVFQSLGASSFCDPDRLDRPTGVGLEDLAIPSPATESAQCLEAAVDRGRAQSLDGHQVLSVVDQIVRPELFPAEVGSPGFSIPAAKGQEVLAVAIDGLGAQILGHQAGEEGNQLILPSGGGRLPYFAQC